ncbi:hypothetical protein J4H86_09140 [Spiractinospora alimapuensis]|uniref:Clp protease N-terminal domain-containing protein n=1 Tax=Spiractinospora alimapuensis TaxID=2820884 RepID=UPI001F2EBC2C|nr:Clp protease N-terminal domain-containing protein [Spiractinospora alimapuensis]QVQ53854.1 hypothetical protein J4H86_09140 [Spiractinospora alimapuensis]
MFERFTRVARSVVIDAQEEANGLNAKTIRPEHLLLGLLAGGGPAARTLHNQGCAESAVRAHASGLDPKALQSIGINLDQVRSTTEAAFGEGSLDRPGGSRPRHIPFAKQSKKALELALREAIRLQQRDISDGHILLGLLRSEDPSTQRLLRSISVDPASLREEMEESLTAETRPQE